MAISDENNNPSSFVQGGGASELMMRQQRRALSVINQNLVGYPPRLINKRPFSEKQDLVHPPNTRKFAAPITNTLQPCPQAQEAKRQNTSVFNSTGFIYIDEEEEDKAAEEDLPVPMFLEETEEAKINEYAEEVEMEDIYEDEEPVMDIDGLDAKNPLAVVEYVEDIYSYYRKMENLSCVSPDYMAKQHDINEKMRAILIDWLIEVHDKFDLLNETLFLTVNLIDRFLAKQTVFRKKLQLVGLVAMLLACKYEEVSVPIVEDLILISDKAYTRMEVLEMERLMLNTLQFNMSLPTPCAFMQRFLKAAKSDKKLEVMSFFFIELCLVKNEMLKYPPSLLAASAIYTAQCTLYGFKQWSKTSKWHTTYSEDQLIECSRLMVSFHQQAGTGKLTGVHRKYCASKYGYAAKCEAAIFILLDNTTTQQVKIRGTYMYV